MVYIVDRLFYKEKLLFIIFFYLIFVNLFFFLIIVEYFFVFCVILFLKLRLELFVMLEDCNIGFKFREGMNFRDSGF